MNIFPEEYDAGASSSTLERRVEDNSAPTHTFQTVLNSKESTSF
jgi:hypothetical protein